MLERWWWRLVLAALWLFLLLAIIGIAADSLNFLEVLS